MTTATTAYVHVVCAACLTENRVPGALDARSLTRWVERSI
jgi:hypothetical protein